jgi:hypothetical protein
MRVCLFFVPLLWEVLPLGVCFRLGRDDVERHRLFPVEIVEQSRFLGIGAISNFFDVSSRAKKSSGVLS